MRIVRAAPPGLYLDGGELGEILLPGALVPRDVKPKDLLDVFVYTDSEDRLVATTEVPKAQVGEFAMLRVVSVNERVGAFLDWGLSKDLLLPFREHEKPVRPGQKVTVFVHVDEHSGRVVATARLARHLSREAPAYQPGEQVEALIIGKTELGYNAIIENAHRGLLFHEGVNVPLQLGQRLKVFVRKVREGGKIDLAMDASGYKRVRALTDVILEALQAGGGKLAMDDDTPPEAIRAKFGASKKAFKQALGALYKKRKIRFASPGIELVTGSENYSPGGDSTSSPRRPREFKPNQI